MKKTTLYLLASLVVNLILRETVEAQSNSPYVTATSAGCGQTVVTISGPSQGPWSIAYSLATNQIVTLDTFYVSGNGDEDCSLNFYFANGNVAQLKETGSGFQLSTASKLQMTGLTSIVFTNFYTGSLYPGFATFTIETPSTNNVSVIPVNSVVIPSDAAGPVQIILESSSDLVNWVPSLPGTYGSTYTNRFFRVRAVIQ
jgi:hypothetical protein